VLAARHGIPFYVAAPLSTIDRCTPTGAEIPIEAFNPAFDVTPAELVTAIFTEAGVLEAPYDAAIERVVSRRDSGGTAPAPIRRSSPSRSTPSRVSGRKNARSRPR